MTFLQDIFRFVCTGLSIFVPLLRSSQDGNTCQSNANACGSDIRYLGYLFFIAMQGVPSTNGK